MQHSEKIPQIAQAAALDAVVSSSLVRVVDATSRDDVRRLLLRAVYIEVSNNTRHLRG